MTDKVQKIKDWISKEQDGLMDAQGNFEYPEHEGAYHILCNLYAYIDSLQEEPIAPKVLKDMLNAKSAAESLGISQEEHDKIVDECLYGKEPELVDFDDMPLDPNIQYASREIGIKAHAEDYSFNIESELFQQLNKEQQELWRKEIEQACMSGGYCGLNLGLDKRYDKEEPVREDLEEAITTKFNELVGGHGEFDKVYIEGVAKAVAIECGFAGAKWQKEHLWKPADGDDLPDIDREVVALLDNGKVVFAHRPPEYWDGKDIVTGKVTRNYPKTYDKGGWNIPDVKYWLDVELPKEIEL